MSKDGGGRKTMTELQAKELVESEVARLVLMDGPESPDSPAWPGWFGQSIGVKRDRIHAALNAASMTIEEFESMVATARVGRVATYRREASDVARADRTELMQAEAQSVVEAEKAYEHELNEAGIRLADAKARFATSTLGYIGATTAAELWDVAEREHNAVIATYRLAQATFDRRTRELREQLEKAKKAKHLGDANYQEVAAMLRSCGFEVVSGMSPRLNRNAITQNGNGSAGVASGSSQMAGSDG